MKIFLALFFFCFSLAFGSEPLEQKLSSSIRLGEGVKAGYLSLPKDKSIDNATYLYVKYALEEFHKQKVSFVLLDLDTPGGEVFSALKIAAELRKSDAENKIPVIAFVDDWALSAGALLAYSCRFIGTTSMGSMGAAEPVMISSDGRAETASEKMVSALRVEFAKTAEIYGRNPLIAEAMVDKDKVLVMRSGETVSLLEDAQIEKGDIVITTKGKLLTLDPVKMKELGVADFTVPAGDPLSGQVLLHAEPFFAKPIAWISYSNWKITFFSVLSHPFVSSLLVFCLMIGIYGAVQSQTFGLSAVLAISSLFFILLSTFAVKLVGSLEAISVGMGIVILIIDVFFFASGFLGGLGLILLLGGLIMMLLPSLGGEGFGPNFSEAGVFLSEWVYRLSVFLSAVLLGMVACIFLGRFFRRRNFFMKKMVLKETAESSEKKRPMPSGGSLGEAFSDLRPSGKVIIEGELYEAVTEGEFVVLGSKVVVLESLENRVIVKEIV